MLIKSSISFTSSRNDSSWR